MRIGVFSDVHDDIQNLKVALSKFESGGIRTLIFCGDFCSPVPAKIMSQYNGRIHCVFGNGDGDRFAIAKIAEKSSSLQLYGEHGELELNGIKLAVTHYPLYGQALARTGDYQAVFSGHTHKVHQQRFEDCLWLNPGDIMGLHGRATCAIFDLKTLIAEIVYL